MDDTTLRELQLFTENDADIYRQTTTPIVRNLRTKQAQGKYDHDRAVDAFMYLAEAGARKYARLHSVGEADWHNIFPVDVRRAAAVAWRDEFEEESRNGNYDNATYLPKKYLDKIAGKKTPASTRSKTAHSEAYYTGMRAGREWAYTSERPDLSPMMRATRSQRKSTLANNKNTSDVAAFLGLPRKAPMSKIVRAYSEYDQGFERGATSVFDAEEGN
jgi:hypothetical protein